MLLDRLTHFRIRKMRLRSLPRLIWHTSMTRLTYQSLRLLLNLEWLLLFTAIFMEVVLPFQPSWSVLLRVVAIVIFGLLGLRLPTRTLSQKLLYTALEFGIIFLAALQDGLSNRSIFLLCLVLVMRSCLIYQQRGQFMVLGLTLMTYATLLLSKPVPARLSIAVWDWRFSNILMFSLTLVFALLLINALIAERQSREQLETAHQELAATHAQLRQYAARIENQATLQERNRIAREIHDGLGHTLVAQTIHLNNGLLFWQSAPDQAMASLKQAKQLGAEALLEVRKSVSMLRSQPRLEQSLQDAIQKLLFEFQNTHKIEVNENLQVSTKTLSSEITTALYRITQEALTNISKHANATTVKIKLEQQSEIIYLSIQDNGMGFNPNQNTTGFGLQGIRERTLSLDGQFNLQSQPGQGCQIDVSLPLAPSL